MKWTVMTMAAKRGAARFLLMICLSLMLPAPAGAAYRTIRPGEQGETVLSLQQALNALGYPLIADGKYGAQTTGAVSAFQSRQRLQADGIAGQMTLSQIYRLAPQFEPPLATAQPATQAPEATATPPAERYELGSFSPGVATLQIRLLALLYDSQRTDGVYDVNTLAAVKAFQMSNGLSADGIAGPATLALLYSDKALREGSQASPRPDDESAAAGTAVVHTGNGGSLKFRTGPSARSDSNLIATLPYGSAVQVIQRGDSWTKIRHSGREGWVMSRYLNFAPGATESPTLLPTATPTATPLPTVLPTGAAGTALVRTPNGRSVNFRSSAENLGDRNVLMTIKNGATLQVTSYGALWSGVEHLGRQGFIMSSMLVFTGAQPTAAPTATLPPLSPTPPPQDASVFPATLQAGDSGETVSLLQSKLANLGYLVTETGNYDDTTVAAVRSFQAINGLGVDGVFGLTSAKMLMSSGVKPAKGQTAQYKVLRVGDKDGPDKLVSRMQTALAALGYKLGVDGSFGNKTHDAVVLFQTQNGLTISGVADIAMQTSLFSGKAVAAPETPPAIDTSGAKSAGPAVSQIKLLDWYTQVKPMIRAGQTALVHDPASGIDFTLQYYSLGAHADSEPKTLRDTQLMNAAFGEASWAIRPVYVKMPGGGWALATMHNNPHLYGNIADNGFGGHLCVHFKRELAETQKADPNYGMQNQVAIRAAWKRLTGEDVQ
ncbi:MAG: peptidoglycan-binding protein [Christensenellales bacterium]